MDQMRSFKLNFLVSRFHRKLQPGWTCPAAVAQSDRELAEGIVGEALQEIIEWVLNRRRSDSCPHSVSDDEVSNNVPDGLVLDDVGWVNSVVVDYTKWIRE